MDGMSGALLGALPWPAHSYQDAEYGLLATDPFLNGIPAAKDRSDLPGVRTCIEARM